MQIKRHLVWMTIMAAAVPVWGQEPAPGSRQSDLGLRSWGVRAGFTSDPDQIVGGVQFHLGEFRRNLRFQPDVQLGVGDDATTLFATAPVYYSFDVQESFTPYAGGGIALGYVDRDLPPTSSGDDSSFEIGARATGGLAWERSGGADFAVELSLGLGDVHDAQIVVLWSFGR